MLGSLDSNEKISRLARVGGSDINGLIQLETIAMRRMGEDR